MVLANLSATAEDTYVGGAFYIMWWKTGDALIKTGHIIAAHTSNDNEVVICPTAAAEPAGVAALQADVDIDTAIADDIMSSFYALKAGTVLRIGVDAGTPSFIKAWAVSTSTTRAGNIRRSQGLGQLVGYPIKTYDSAADKWIEAIT